MAGLLNLSSLPCFFLLFVLLLGDDITHVQAGAPEDCKAMKPVQGFNFEVEWKDSSKTCTLRCKAEGENYGCMTSPDAFQAAFERAGIAMERSVCQKTSTPSEDDPEHVVVTCPEFREDIDMHGTGKLGKMTLELDMYKEVAIKAVKDLLSPSVSSPSGTQFV
mmetsp:Transcript_7614/g.10973  ORF Transcript_7614/g.10973 Transcript_7614/m.10973 type:complete len:163 (+) Transcript_7614:94-582(+)